MIPFWYVCDGNVEEYSEQEANWINSVLVVAKSPENALIKVMQYHQGLLKRDEVFYNGKTISAIF